MADAVIVGTENADRAKELLRTLDPDILISDIHLTTKDPDGGLRVIAKAREMKGDNLIIIAMSGEDCKNKAMKAGANHFHSKRHEEETLAQLVSTLWQENEKTKGAKQ